MSTEGEDHAGSSIAAALVAFQAECRDVAPNAEANTGKFKYRYADLSTVLAELRPKLAKHGLAVLQSPFDHNGDVGVRTTILHKSGESFDAGTILLPMTQQTPQGAGACITYARRYALGAISGIAVDHDDDAAPGQQKPAPKPPAEQRGGEDENFGGPPPVTGGKVFDQKLGFGKHGDRTWREMTEGSIQGDRHRYLLWLQKECAKKIKEEPDSTWDKDRREKLHRVEKCLEIIANRASREAAEADAEQPELGDAEGF